MRPADLSKVFQSVSAVFQDCNLYIISRSDHVMFCREVLSGSFELLDFDVVPAKPAADVRKLFFPLDSERKLIVFLPADTYPDSEAVAHMIESLLQLIFLQENERPKTPVEALFLTRLFQAATHEDTTYIALLAAEQKIDFSIDRAVCILQPANPPFVSSNSEAVIHAIRRFISSESEDFAGLTAMGEIVLCHALPGGKPLRRTQEEEFFSAMQQYLWNIFRMRFVVSVGVPVKEIVDYPFSIQLARLALQHSGDKSPIIFGRYFLMEYMLTILPEQTLHHFLVPYIRILEDTPSLLETVEAFVSSNFEIGAAAVKNYVHRNTMVFRLNQLRQAVHLDPIQNDSHRFLLMLVHTYYKCFHSAADHAQ